MHKYSRSTIPVGGLLCSVHLVLNLYVLAWLGDQGTPALLQSAVIHLVRLKVRFVQQNHAQLKMFFFLVCFLQYCKYIGWRVTSRSESGQSWNNFYITNQREVVCFNL